MLINTRLFNVKSIVVIALISAIALYILNHFSGDKK